MIHSIMTCQTRVLWSMRKWSDQHPGVCMGHAGKRSGKLAPIRSCGLDITTRMYRMHDLLTGNELSGEVEHNV